MVGLHSIMELIDRIEQAGDGGLGILMYITYKTINAVSSQPAFIHMPRHIYSIPEWTEFRNGPEHVHYIMYRKEKLNLIFVRTVSPYIDECYFIEPVAVVPHKLGDVGYLELTHYHSRNCYSITTILKLFKFA